MLWRSHLVWGCVFLPILAVDSHGSTAAASMRRRRVCVVGALLSPLPAGLYLMKCKNTNVNNRLMIRAICVVMASNDLKFLIHTGKMYTFVGLERLNMALGQYNNIDFT